MIKSTPEPLAKPPPAPGLAAGEDSPRQGDLNPAQDARLAGEAEDEHSVHKLYTLVTYVNIPKGLQTENVETAE